MSFDPTYNPYSLVGKTILITGASSGIGRATAIECSKMGAICVITGRNEERLNEVMCELAGDNHSYIVADLVNTDSLNSLVNNAPLLDGLVLCAGQGLMLPFPYCSREKYNALFDVNFFAPVELLRLMVKKKKLQLMSSVVMVTSVGGVESFGGCNSVYGATKAALNATMKYCARELAPKKIRFNSVAPGMTNTKLIQHDTMTEEQFKADIQRYPLKRYGEPMDIAHGIIYLLGDASSWVTGHSLVIDGGFTI